jgi:gamma-glutamyl-gamma-aminobutyrate hydrolase PuuD
MALADDGIIEAVYADGERYMRAYQWHPERLVDKDDDNKRIFDSFIEACGYED